MHSALEYQLLVTLFVRVYSKHEQNDKNLQV